MPRCHGASRYPGGGKGQLRVVSLTGLGTNPPQLVPSLPAGCISGPGFLLHLWFLWSCTAGCPHFVSFRRALVSPAMSPVSPTLFPAPSHPVFLLNTPCSYLMVSSVVGFYSSPLFTRLLPERQDTPLTKVGAAGRGWGAPLGVQDPVPHSVPLCTACDVPRWEDSVLLPGRTPHLESPFSSLGVPCSSTAPPQTFSFSPDHRELCLPAGAQLSAACLLQDTG